MNKIKEFLNKLHLPTAAHFVVERRQAAWLIAAVFFVCIVSFVAGYFWGKRTAIEQFCQRVEGESFADQIYAAMSLNIEGEGDADKGSDEPDEAVGADASDQEQEDSEMESTAEASVVANISDGSQSGSWYAQLIGFRSRREADIFAARLAKRDIPVTINEHVSTTASGRKTTWFQVVTKPFASRSELEKLTDALAYEEKIHGIRIIES